MNENEAKVLENAKRTVENLSEVLYDIEEDNVKSNNEIFKDNMQRAETIISVFNELEQYRSIGTVKQIEEMKIEFAKMIVDLRMYRKIGALDECRVAMEKQRAMKPAEIYKYTGGGKGFKCGSCGRKNVFGDVCCSKCGQRVLYEDKEQAE